MRALVLHNPGAGAGGVSRKELTAVLRKAGIDGRYVSTKDKSYPDALAETDKIDFVVAAGGDGTVSRTVKYIGDRETPIAVLPLGGSNNIARSFGLSRAWQDIPERWKDGETRKLDVGCASGPWGVRMFVEGCGLGAIARTASAGRDDIHPAEKIQFGRNNLRKLLMESKPDQVQLTLDGEEMAHEILMFEALNIPFGGASLRLADADPGDGLLDFVCVTPEHREEIESWIVEPHDPPPPSIFHKRGKKLEIEWDGVPLHIDDHIPKPRKYPRKVIIELRSRPATIMVPSQDDES